MKKRLQRLAALMMAILFIISANAQALENITASNSWSWTPATETSRPEGESTPGAEGQQPAGSEVDPNAGSGADPGASQDPNVTVDLNATVDPNATVGPEASLEAEAPATQAPDHVVLFQGKVSVENELNVRSAPNTDSEVITKLSNGATVNVIKEAGDWYQILLTSGATGYVKAQYIVKPGEETPEPTEVPSTELSLEITPHDPEKPYGEVNQPNVFDVVVTGGSNGRHDVIGKIERDGETIQNEKAFTYLQNDYLGAKGQFTYTPDQAGAYRLTLSVEDSNDSTNAAEAQLDFVVIDPNHKEYLCGKEEHMHTAECYTLELGGSIEVLTCDKEEHTHDDSCLVPAASEADEDSEASEAPEGSESPEGDVSPETSASPETSEAPEGDVSPETSEAPEASVSPEASETPEGGVAPETSEAPEGGEAPEASESPEATIAPEVTPEPTVVPGYLCGMAEHVHSDANGCYKYVPHEGESRFEGELDRILICELPEHTHTQDCFPKAYACGKVEHTHTPECYDAEGNLICGLEEHTHGPECEVMSDVGQNMGDLEEYIRKNGGSLAFDLIDPKTNQSLIKGGKAEVFAGQPYKLQMTFDCPNGIQPGIYTYPLPEGVDFSAMQGGPVVITDKDDPSKKTTIGTWSVDPTTKQLKFELDERANNITDLDFIYSLDIQFREDAGTVDYEDWTITVKPSEQKDGSFDKSANESDRKSIFPGIDEKSVNMWRIKLTNMTAQSLAGKTLSDELQYGDDHFLEHEFTQADKDRGVVMTLHDEHKIVLKPVVWSGESPCLSWEYTFPDPDEKLECICGCGKSYSLKELDEMYPNLSSQGMRIYYTSTNTKASMPNSGSTTYENTARLGEVEDTASRKVDFSRITGVEGEKTANGDTDVNGDGYYDLKYTLTGTIPGYVGEGSPAVEWNFTDWTYFEDSEQEDLKYYLNNHLLGNDPNTVVKLNGVVCNAIRLGDNDWLYVNEAAGIACRIAQGWGDEAPDANGAHVYFYNKCECASHRNEVQDHTTDGKYDDMCQKWKNGQCVSPENDTVTAMGYCACWYRKEAITFEITYYAYGDETFNALYPDGVNRLPDPYYLYNNMNLGCREWSSNEHKFKSEGKVWKSYRETLHDILKKRVADFADLNNGYTAEFELTINENKYPLEKYLTGSDKHLILHDEMSQYLFYVSGSLEVYEDDSETPMPESAYKMTLDEDGHGFDLEIINPGNNTLAHKYTVVYKALLNAPNSASATYNNKASLNLKLSGMEVDTEETKVQDYNASGTNYKIKLKKTGVNGEALSGAKFQLVGADGSNIGKGNAGTKTTGTDGILEYETNVTDAIVFAPHVLYYLEEVEAPAGYAKLTDKVGFYFCNKKKADTCDDCKALEGKGTRVAKDQDGVVITIENSPSPASLNIPVEKKIDGDGDAKGEKFTFTLTPKDNADNVKFPEGKSSLQIEIDGANTKSFEGIEFAEEGIYTFEITENNLGSNSAFRKDETVWKVEVKVEKQATGLEVVETTYYKKVEGGNFEKVTPESGAPVTVVFTNKHKTPEPTIYQPKAKKVVRVNNDAEPSYPEFTFQLTKGTFTPAEGTNDDGRFPAYENFTSEDSKTPFTSDEQTVKDFSKTESEKMVTFDNLQFTEAGTYTFSIAETAPAGGNGWKMDQTSWTLTVVVGKNAETNSLFIQSVEYTRAGNAASKWESGSSADQSAEFATITNTFTPGNGEFTPRVKKTVSGNGVQHGIAGEGQTFNFKLDWASGMDESLKSSVTPNIPCQASITVTTDNQDTATGSFGQLTFDKAGTYKFTITEMGSYGRDWQKDTSTKYLTVKVGPDVDENGDFVVRYSTNQNGTSMQEGKESDPADFPFANTYTAKTDVEVQKVWANGDTYNDKVPEGIQVTLSSVPSDPAVSGRDDLTVTLNQEHDWKYEWKNLPKYGSNNQLIQYSVAEAKPDAGWVVGYTNQPTNDGTITITNTFTPAKFTPQVKKEVVKRVKGDNSTPVWPTEGFTFTIESVGDAPTPTSKTVTITETGESMDWTKAFGDIVFTAEGTYTYTITETVPNPVPDGWKYANPHEHKLTVKVGVDEETNALVVESVMLDDTTDLLGTDKTTATVSFTNTWQKPEVSEAPSITKKITGAGAKDGRFTFSAKLKSVKIGETEYTAETGLKENFSDLIEKKFNITTDKLTGSLEDTAANQFTFTKSGTYTFEITEDNPDVPTDNPNFDQNTTVWTWTVTVENNKEGKLEVTKSEYSYTGEDGNPVTGTPAGGEPGVVTPFSGATFINPYHAKTSVTVEKKWAGTLPEGVVQPSSVQVQLLQDGKKYEPTGDETPEGFENPVTLTAGEDGFWSYTWDNLPKYNEAEKDAPAYEYTVEELNIPEPYTAKVTGGKVDAEGESIDPSTPDEGFAKYSYTITNTYAPANYQPKVLKKWTGDLPDNWSATFTFELSGGKNTTAEGADAKLPTDTTVKITIPGDSTEDNGVEGLFDAVEFTEPGTYTFTITEQAFTNKPGWTADSAGAWTLMVEVTKDEKTGALSVTSVTYTRDTEISMWPTEDESTAITAAAATFKNTYKPGYTYAHIDVKKTVKLGEGAYKGAVVPKKTFTFTLEHDGDEKYESETEGFSINGGSAQVTITLPNDDGDTIGSTKFTNVKFTKAGNYHFIMKETQETDMAGWTYDDSIWSVVVNVTDFKGQLEASVTYSYVGDNRGTRSNYEFINVYTPPTTKASVTKTWSGDDGYEDTARPGSITVTLKAQIPKKGTPEEYQDYELPNSVETVVTLTAGEDGTWSHTWNDLPKYAQDGTTEIKYSVVEDKVPGYTLNGDKSVLTGPDKDGNYTFTLVNDYTPDKTSYTPVVEKTVKGAEALSETFNFTLSADSSNDTTGYKLDATNASVTLPDTSGNEGTASFGAIEFTKPGTYTFTIKEDEPEGKNKNENFAYDKSVWTLTVTVTPDTAKPGALKAEASYSKEGVEPNGEAAEFVNTYTAKTQVEVEKVWHADATATKPEITAELLKDGESFEPEKTTTLNAEHEWKATFDNLDKYDEDGNLITYSVQEEDLGENYAVSYQTVTTATHNPPNGSTSSGPVQQIINTQLTDLSVTKEWDDDNNRDRKRPLEIKVTLYANGEQVDIADNPATLKPAEEDSPDTAAVWPTHTWHNLPKYDANGELINYSVTEAFAGDTEYQNTDTSFNKDTYTFTITNTYTPDETSRSVTKEWDDDGNRDGLRPTEVEVQLLANGESYHADGVENPVTLNAGNDWSHTWNNLPVNENGEPINYYVEEITELDGYSSSNKFIASYDKRTGAVTYQTNSFVIVNTHKPDVVEKSVTKVWNDANNQDGLRPESIWVQLYADGEASGTPVELTAENGWSYKWENLPKNEYDATTATHTREIVYTVQEVGSTAGYTTEYDQTTLTITNTHKPAETERFVQKIWNDADNQDDKRTESIEVQLLADGVPYGDPVELNEENDWSYKWESLPKFKQVEGDTHEIVYSVRETRVPNGYEASYGTHIAVSSTEPTKQETTYVITNTHTPETVERSVKKVWADADNQDGKRPESVSVQLYAGSEAYDPAVTLSEANGWSYSWENLPKYKDGVEIEYSVQETEVPEGYEAAVTWTTTTSATLDPTTNMPSTTTAVDFTITNTHEPETVERFVQKVWDDGENQDGLRNEDTAITVQLLANGEPYGNYVTLNAANNWTYNWENLPKNADGKEITYSVEESGVPEGYESVVTKGTQTRTSSDRFGIQTETEIEGFVITNTHTPETVEHFVQKVWVDGENQDGLRPEGIEVQLLADDEPYGPAVTLNDSNNWTYNWENLPAKAAGEDIEYSVAEVTVPEGYSSDITAGTQTRESMDRFGIQTETEIDGWIITNTHEPETVEHFVQKVWADGDDQDGLRVDSIEAQLLADGEAYGPSVTLSKANNWTYNWENLPKNAGGKEITYSVEESGVPEGYDSVVTEGTQTSASTDPVSGMPTTTVTEGFVITNTHEPETVERFVQKVWVDGENQDGLRPESIEVQLLADDEPYGPAVTLSEANGWTYNWKNLPKFEGGKEITYSVEESGVPEGYDSVVTEGTQTSASTDPVSGMPTTTVTEGFVITNTHEPETVEHFVQKVWVDGENQDGLRVDSIEVQLLADGEAYGAAVTLSEANGWTYNWENLPKNVNDGDGTGSKEIVYSVEESGVPEGYDSVVTKGTQTSASTDGSGSQIEGFIITNTHTPAVTRRGVEKVWDDNQNQDGIRPESIQVQLRKNVSKPSDEDERFVAGVHENFGAPVTLNASNNWSYTWENLPVYDNGLEIEYTIQEVDVPEGYEASYTTRYDAALEGSMPEEMKTVLVVTNTHTPEVVEKTVTKAWNDSDDQDGMRPESISVQLMADDEVSGAPVELNEANSWTYTWTGLPKNRDHGTEIVYTVQEVGTVTGYTTAQTTDATTGDVTITNSHTPETVEKSVTKVWADVNDADDLRPESISVQLLANGKPYGDSVTLTGTTNRWTHTWTNLPKYADGEEITYTVQELGKITGYTTAYDQATLTITNTHTPVVSRTVRKVWANDSAALRPGSIVVGLYRNGDLLPESGSVTLNADNGWSHTWNNLTKFDPSGREYTYTVREISGPQDYTSSVTSSGTTFTITNTYVPPMTARTVMKVWDDVDDLDGIRPASITVELLADGTRVRTATLSAANNWRDAWNNLPLYRTGTRTLIEYTVQESGTVEGYTSTVTGGGTAFTIVNSHTPNPRSYSVRKVWDDGDNTDVQHPDSVQVQLQANGIATGAVVTLNEANNWSHTWNDLPAVSNGAAITYSVVEVNTPAEYTPTYTLNGTEFVITNSYTPRTTEVAGMKIWQDASNVRGLRPESIEIQLYQNGEPMQGYTQTLTGDGNEWSYRFENLPYADESGQPYTYAVDEVPVQYYTTEVNGYTIVNTVIPQTISIEGTKTWADNNNAAGLRPASITVRLMRQLGNGTPELVATQTVMAANGWYYRFDNLPDSDPATGQLYTYSISEVLVTGYYTIVDGYNLTNVPITPTTPGPGTEGTPPPAPGENPVVPIDDYDTPLGVTALGEPTEEELESLIEMDDYETPLWGELLQTGDDLPAYPFVFGGIGIVSLLAALLLDRKKRKKEQ